MNISDPRTSPFIHTVYGGYPSSEDSSGRPSDNRLILAWNDQHPRKEREKNDRRKSIAPASSSTSEGVVPQLVDQEQSSDEETETDNTFDGDYSHKEEFIHQMVRLLNSGQSSPKATKGSDDSSLVGSGKDVYGNGASQKSAHSKGILGMSVKPLEGGQDEGVVKFYLISHSFPAVPNAIWDDGSIPMHRTSLHPERSKFFGKSITGKYSNAQHAVCISMEQRVQLADGEIVFDRSEVDYSRMNLFAILEGLSVIGPSITLTNYVPWLEQHRVYHQLFDIRSTWSDQPINPDEQIKNSNLARAFDKDRPAEYTIQPVYPVHAFPLWPSRWALHVGSDGTETYRHHQNSKSLRDPGQVFAVHCRFWDRPGNCDEKCFFSATLRSAGLTRAAPIVFQVDFKNGLLKADTDDIISARLVPGQDIVESLKIKASEGTKYFSVVVIVQSWYERGTFGANSLDIVDNPALKVKAWFHNVLRVSMPDATGNSDYIQNSPAKDHSKWFVVYPYQTGHYRAIAGFMDLNRSIKATQPSGLNHGRGGMFLFTTSPDFVRFFMNLRPCTEYNTAFKKVPSTFFTAYHQQEDPSALQIAQLIGYQKQSETNNWGIIVKLCGSAHAEKFFNPYDPLKKYTQNSLQELEAEYGSQSLLQEQVKNITPQKVASSEKSNFLIGSPFPPTANSPPSHMKPSYYPKPVVTGLKHQLDQKEGSERTKSFSSTSSTKSDALNTKTPAGLVGVQLETLSKQKSPPYDHRFAEKRGLSEILSAAQPSGSTRPTKRADHRRGPSSGGRDSSTLTDNFMLGAALNPVNFQNTPFTFPIKEEDVNQSGVFPQNLPSDFANSNPYESEEIDPMQALWLNQKDSDSD